MTTSRFRLPLAAGVLLAAISAGALAQVAAPAPPAAPSAHAGHHDPVRMQERMAARMAALKEKLQITSAQESAWTSFTTAMRPSGDMKRMDREALSRMSTPDRIDQMRLVRQQRAAEMDRRGEATKAFYAALTPEQQKVFDQETARMGGHHKRMHGKHHGQTG